MSQPDLTTLTKKIAQLANLEIKANEINEYAQALNSALDVVDQLAKIDVTGVEPTTRVSTDINRWRADEIDYDRMFTQEQALTNAAKTANGYFVVGRLIDHEA